MQKILRQKLLFVFYNYNTIKKRRAAHKEAEAFASAYVCFSRYQCDCYEVNVSVGLQVVEETINYFKLNGRGIDRFIELYFFKKRGRAYIMAELNISEGTVTNWKREVLEMAETVLKNLQKTL